MMKSCAMIRDMATATLPNTIPDEATQWRELGRRLRRARVDAGLSQQDAADHLGTSRSAISEMERGNRKTYALELRDLACLYGCAPAVLLGEPLGTTGLLGVDLPIADLASVVQFVRFLHYRRGAPPTRANVAHENSLGPDKDVGPETSAGAANRPMTDRCPPGRHQSGVREGF
ncbi:helix-turn-helix domain-containing protein [Nocardia fluminea]|uniref:helix-turn-helix domain-containing protein n=1 Tax=Nocardia fluminea TaxID=134984 RepID=UPI0036582FB2